MPTDPVVAKKLLPLETGFVFLFFLWFPLGFWWRALSYVLLLGLRWRKQQQQWVSSALAVDAAVVPNATCAILATDVLYRLLATYLFVAMEWRLFRKALCVQLVAALFASLSFCGKRHWQAENSFASSTARVVRPASPWGIPSGILARQPLNKWTYTAAPHHFAWCFPFYPSP